MPTWMLGIGYSVVAAIFLRYLMHSRAITTWRRYITNFTDTSLVTLSMITAEEFGLPVFLLDLWITSGNGFRFGLPALIVSTALSVAGFSLVVALTEVWRNNPALVIGVFLVLIMIPLQTAQRILQHQRNWSARESAIYKTNHVR